MSNELIRFSQNILQTISDTLALSDKLLLISEAERYYKLAAEEHKNENYTLAKEYILKAVELHPRFYNAHLELIALYLETDEYEDALYYSELALKLFPENSAFFYSRGMIKAIAFEKHEEAIADFSRAIELEQLSTVKSLSLHDFYLKRAESKMELGDKEGSDSDHAIYLQLLELFERNKKAK